MTLYTVYIIICIYICTYRTEATEKYIRYSHQHRKILVLAQMIENLLSCSTFSSEVFHIGFGQMEDVLAVESHLCPSHTRANTHTHTHTHYARTGLPVKGNQIQKGSSQLVLKVDSTCRDLRITSGFTLVQQNKCTEQFKQKRTFFFNLAAVHLNSKHVFALEKGANSVAQILILPVDSS